ncbi:MAG: hypothetical protein Q9212_003848 [Teloschistes hypoglaucus]
MNHLPWPRNEQYPPLQIPYVCGDLPDFDGLDFKKYPIRRDWSTPEKNFQWIDTCPRITGKRVQNWLLSGLLHVFLGYHFKKQDFIAWSSSDDIWIIDSSKLPRICSDVINSIQHDVRLGKIGSSARKNLRRKWSAAFSEAKLQFEFYSGNLAVDLDDELMLVVSPVPILLQSWKRLARRVFWRDEIPIVEKADLAPAPLSIWRILDEHWCKSQISSLLQLGPFLNHYVSALPRSQLNRHDAGCSFSRCVANNVDESTYNTRHVQDTCSCVLIGTDAGRLADLIQKNHIPVIQLRLVNGEPKMEMIAADISMQYMSISHVWAGGLGNFKANELPSCQLARLYRRLDALARLRSSRPKLESFDFRAQHPGWLGLCLRATQALQMLAMKSAARTKETISCIHRTYTGPSEPEQLPPVYFWMDTLCIPVSPQHRKLRQKAIGNMALTYAATDRCLVLDPELERIEMRGLTPLQLNAHMFCSTWLTRSWTFQEARLSRAWLAQFADCLYNPNSRANGVLNYRLYSDWIVNRSDAQELESEMIS